MAGRGRETERIAASPSDSRARGGPEKVRYAVWKWPQNRVPYITTRAVALIYATARRTFFRVCFCKLCGRNALRGYSGSPVFGFSNSRKLLGMEGPENRRSDIS